MKPFSHTLTRVALILTGVAFIFSFNSLLKAKNAFYWLTEDTFSNGKLVGFAALMGDIVLPLGALAIFILGFVLKSHLQLKTAFILFGVLSFGVPTLIAFVVMSGWSFSLGAYEEYADYADLGWGAVAALAAMVVYLVGVKESKKTEAWSATDSLNVEQPLAGMQAPVSSAPAPRPGFKGFMGALLDHRLENFISRKVAGVMYIIVAWLIIVFGVLLVVASLYQLSQGFGAAIFSLLLSPVVTLLLLVIVRMAFESGVALIVVAENTKKY
jgi:hypothetical protein